MLKRFVAVGLALGMMISPIAVLAQADPRCIALSEEDCTLYTNALANMQSVDSFNAKDFSLRLGGSGGTSEGNDLDVMGSGPVLIDNEGHISALSFDVTGNLTGEESETDTPGKLVLLDDMLYTGSTDEDGELQWTGVQTDSEDNDQVFKLVTGSIWDAAFLTPGASVVIRGEDVEADGQTMAVFNVQIDLITFLLTPSILDSLETLMASSADNPAASGSDTPSIFSSEDFDLAGAIRLLPILMSEDTVEAVVWVNPADGLVYHVEFVIDVALDATLIDPELGETTFNFNLATDLDQHGEDFAIEAPEDYELLTNDAIDFSTFSFDGLGGDSASTPSQPAELEPIEDTLAYGETVSGTLSEDNESDIWGFNAKAGDVVTITAKAGDPESSLDMRIFLQTEDGEQLAFNDDHDSERDDLMIFDAELDSIEIPADGKYRIVATWLIPDEVGDYELTLEQVK